MCHKHHLKNVKSWKKNIYYPVYIAVIGFSIDGKGVFFMKMLKSRVIWFVLALALLWNAGNVCRAEILPPHGEGQIGLEAVVLCESLTVRKDRSASSQAVKTLRYGEVIIVQENWDGWANCFLSDAVDAGPAGWVNSDYILMDPAWYRTDDTTPVFAWDDTMAPKVALLSKGTVLPILKDQGDWLIVSLRGATGWIYKNAADRMATDTKDMIRSISDLEKAEVVTPKGTYTLSDREGLQWIEENFSIAQPIMSAGCPFDGTLTLFKKDGSTVTLYVATDSCRNFRTEDGGTFAYGNGEEALRLYDSTSIIGETFWGLFGISANDMYMP